MLVPLIALVLVGAVVIVVVRLNSDQRITGSGDPGTFVPAPDSPTTPMTPPLDFSGFDPGDIISNEVFYNDKALTQEQIAEFIASWNAGCVPGVEAAPDPAANPSGVEVPCLAGYVEDTPSFAADTYCPIEFEGAQGDDAAAIIWKVARSCGINPQVLLVTLQKEQGLVTASGTGLDSSRYTIAMGYACPDTSNCDPRFFGFATQLYYAARQFRIYEYSAEAYSVRAGQTQEIAFAPDPSCGSTQVTVANQATANLYNYTPYQPNQAALAGESDACSTFGNLNFHAYFRAWFGATH